VDNFIEYFDEHNSFKLVVIKMFILSLLILITYIFEAPILSEPIIIDLLSLLPIVLFIFMNSKKSDFE